MYLYVEEMEHGIRQYTHDKEPQLCLSYKT